MSSMAALQGGAGIVRLLHPAGLESDLASGLMEIIKISFEYPHDLSLILEQLNKASAVFIGPGMGRIPKQKNSCKRFCLS